MQKMHWVTEWLCEVTITSKALLEKAIEEGAAVVTEGWAGVGLVTEPMFGVIILKLPQPVRLTPGQAIGGISESVVF